VISLIGTPGAHKYATGVSRDASGCEEAMEFDVVGMKAGLIHATTGGPDRRVADGVKAGQLKIVGERRAA